MQPPPIIFLNPSTEPPDGPIPDPAPGFVPHAATFRLGPDDSWHPLMPRCARCTDMTLTAPAELEGQDRLKALRSWRNSCRTLR